MTAQKSRRYTCCRSGGLFSCHGPVLRAGSVRVAQDYGARCESAWQPRALQAAVRYLASPPKQNTCQS